MSISKRFVIDVKIKCFCLHQSSASVLISEIIKQNELERTEEVRFSSTKGRESLYRRLIKLLSYDYFSDYF